MYKDPLSKEDIIAGLESEIDRLTYKINQLEVDIKNVPTIQKIDALEDQRNILEEALFYIRGDNDDA